MLIAKCLQSNNEELWEDLVRRLQPIFARIVYRIASSNSIAEKGEVDDLIQDCFLKLGSQGRSPSLPASALKDEESIVAYLRSFAANTARDYYRRKRAEKRGAERTTSIEDAPNEIVGAKVPTPETAILIEQVDRVLDADSNGRTIFWLYYQQGFTAREIAQIPAFRLTVKGVESVIRRLTLLVRQQMNCEPEGIFGRETF